MIKKILQLALFVCPYFYISQTQGQDDPLSVAPEISSFNVAPDNIGSVQNSVNLFTGDLNLPIKLVSISGKEGLGINVNITYNSNVQNQVDTWNLDAPTGILGLGWSMDMPKIVCDHKNTGTREDDIYYLIEGQSSNRLIRTGAGSDASGTYNTYTAKKYKFWKIKFYFDPADYLQTGDGANKWVILKENGFKYIYGDKNSGRSTIQYTVRWNNWIGSSSNTANQSQMASTWNLSEISNTWGEKITYEYLNIDQYVGSTSGQKHTEASYLKQIVDPVGRKVQFFYNNKSSQFYMEPHTEQAEPDAYQENYEKLYLDHIDVLQETGVRYLTVNLRYTTINDGGNTAKMLLSYIENRNNSNQALPGIRLDYFTTTSSTGYKGFLQRITYPTGGAVTYSYAMSNNSIGHSNRNINIPAPPADSDGPKGYANPNMWFGPDYVVVTWQALGDSPQPVKLYVYQWVGEWKVQYIQSIPGVLSSDMYNTTSFDDTHYNMQIVLEDNFFGVMVPNGTYYGTGWPKTTFFTVIKDEANRGKWSIYNPGIIPLELNSSLLSGDNFVAICTDNNYKETTVQQVFTFNGTTFSKVSSLKGTFPYVYGYQNSGAGPNYLIRHVEIGGDYTTSFYYLNEEKTFKSTELPSTVDFSDDQTLDRDYREVRYFGGNSFVARTGVHMYQHVFRWDLNYSNFVKDRITVYGVEADGYVIDNSLFGTNGYSEGSIAARFDGNSWSVGPELKTTNPAFNGFGSDFLVSTSSDASGPTRNLCVFDPNSGLWSQTSSHEPSGRISVAKNFYTNGVNNYYRMPNGSWNLMGNIDGVVAGNCIVSSLGSVNYFKNGSYSSNTDPFEYQNFAYYDYVLPAGKRVARYLKGFNILAKINSTSKWAWTSYPNYVEDVKSLDLYKAIGEDITGLQVDYPVSSITVSGNNSTNENVSFEYNFSTATIDPTGNLTHFSEVNVIPGSAIASTKPNGYTKTYFNNGLTSIDDTGIPSIAGVSIDQRWIGQPYQINVYDAGGNIVSTTTTNYTSTTLPVNNSLGIQVDIASYVVPSSVDKITDGIETKVEYSFDQTTSGLIRSQKVYHPSNSSQYEKMDYIYAYEKYDPTMFLNSHLFTPVAQVTRTVNGVVTEVKATRYKNWNSINNLPTSSTAPAAFDQFVWKGTNNSQFSSWSVTMGESPLPDWALVQKVTVRDDYTGEPLEVLTTGNRYSAIIMDQYKIRALAKITNSNYNQCAYSSFEDASQGNWVWSDGTIVSGTAKTGNKYITVGTTGISKPYLDFKENYVLSFWAMSSGGTLSITGVGTVIVNSPSTWTYYEYPVTSLTSLNLNMTGSSNVFIDELRLYPKQATMSTTTYDPVFGPTAQMDSNNRTVYTQYDGWGRVLNTLDENFNIIKSFVYNIKE